VKATFVLPAYYHQYRDWAIKSSTLAYRKQTFFLHVTVEKESPPPQQGEILGIDQGIVNLVVCSNNRFFNSKHVKNVRARYVYLRQQLQSQGTRSAKRKLRRLAGREKRFMADVNHGLTKAIVRMAFGVFAIEDLTKIRVQKRRGKPFNRKLHQWAFYQFEQFLHYKAEALGKEVLRVDPRYSSQKCSNCGHIYRGNRHGSAFWCRKCGLQLHADLNAARNIAQAGRACLGRLPVNQPMVARDDESGLSDSDLSYKLRPSGRSS
jgi:IS605 OrfB family transposase